MNDGLEALLKQMLIERDTETILRVASMLAQNVSDLEERIKGLESLLPTERVVDPWKVEFAPL